MRIIFRHCGATCGKNLQADGLVRVRCYKKESIHIGENCLINARRHSNLVGQNNPSIFDCKNNGRIYIGDNCGLSFVVISSRSQVSIGDNARLGANVRILDHNYHSLSYLARRNVEMDQKDIQSSPITIGNDVFIGANALILKGVTIGDRAIVGAASVVSRNIPAGEIWAGNPARKVGVAT